MFWLAKALRNIPAVNYLFFLSKGVFRAVKNKRKLLWTCSDKEVEENTGKSWEKSRMSFSKCVFQNYSYLSSIVELQTALHTSEEEGVDEPEWGQRLRKTCIHSPDIANIRFSEEGCACGEKLWITLLVNYGKSSLRHGSRARKILLIHLILITPGGLSHDISSDSSSLT